MKNFRVFTKHETDVATLLSYAAMGLEGSCTAKAKSRRCRVMGEPPYRSVLEDT